MDFLNICLTALCSFAALFIIAKFIGHKQVAQLDFFDYVTGITIGSIRQKRCFWRSATGI